MQSDLRLFLLNKTVQDLFQVTQRVFTGGRRVMTVCVINKFVKVVTLKS